MRTAVPLLALLLPACMVPTPPKDPADTPAQRADADQDEDTPEVQVQVEERGKSVADPILPPPPPPDLQGIDVVGHGLRITMYPPFQVSLADDFVLDYGEKGATGGLILSWWNVADPKVGGRMGTGALYNAGAVIKPVPESDETPPIVEGRQAWPDGREGVTYRLGETGSYVILPPELKGAGGMLTVAPGPADPTWAVEVDGQRTPLERKKIMHSADPAEGPGFVLDGRPHQPWGPWPERMQPPPRTGNESGEQGEAEGG